MAPGYYRCPYQDRPPTPRSSACPVCPVCTAPPGLAPKKYLSPAVLQLVHDRRNTRNPIMQTHTDAMAAGLGGWKKSLSVRVWDTIMMVALLYKSEVTVKSAYETEHFD
ncbi:hypothetical protein BFJ66_g11787 [Fusarium oxysporum f. sp. cepae]|uniref:Uncharacterized protein n=1 Tax=Fusarium oxysporum f. sp. cepae TaxID=396571 RepID=A0A3L6MZB4_FUSOX|nr:hypothetical protein BFJ65_g15625 [Fusarium oxysporum f. sp. cepae]RKK39884.1 hypothetical protein BFJ66_g11787 [Fusarium oxysporum f. sp. cepae]RKK42480.1 hypothetical protein BFJ67_g10065 [Fusarium oxysporum f. sp. cepae]